MITRLEKADYLSNIGYEIKVHRKVQKSGYIRTYIDEIEGVCFTTASTDQAAAGRILDALYWQAKLQEGKIWQRKK